MSYRRTLYGLVLENFTLYGGATLSLLGFLHQLRLWKALAALGFFDGGARRFVTVAFLVFVLGQMPRCHIAGMRCLGVGSLGCGAE